MQNHFVFVLLLITICYEIFSKFVATGEFSSSTVQDSPSQATQDTADLIQSTLLSDEDNNNSDDGAMQNIFQLSSPITATKDGQKRYRAGTDSPPPSSYSKKKPRTATHAAAESMQELANAFKEAKQMRAPPPITKLEQALEIMTTFVEKGLWTDNDYMTAYKLIM